MDATKIADDAVTADHLLTDSVTSDAIAANQCFSCRNDEGNLYFLVREETLLTMPSAQLKSWSKFRDQC